MKIRWKLTNLKKNVPKNKSEVSKIQDGGQKNNHSLFFFHKMLSPAILLFHTKENFPNIKIHKNINF